MFKLKKEKKSELQYYPIFYSINMDFRNRLQIRRKLFNINN